MPKPVKHPLDPLFRAKLRDISWAQFQAMERSLSSEPAPWRWPDPKRGVEWTLMGRKADLLWRAPATHHVKNHTTTAHTVQQAIRQNEVWHESVPGKPDILMLWLGSMREGIANGKIQTALGIALRKHEAGLGKPGDGGYLDRMISIVEQESQEEQDPERRKVIHEATSRKWLNGVILRSIQPGSGDWRSVATQTLPILWPIETLERVLALAQHNCPDDQQVFFMASTAAVLVQQLQGNPVSTRMIDLLTRETLINPRAAQHGALAGLEHYAERDAVIDARVLEAIAPHLNEEWIQAFPRLRSLSSAHQMQCSTPAASPRHAKHRL